MTEREIRNKKQRLATRNESLNRAYCAEETLKEMQLLLKNVVKTQKTIIEAFPS